MTGVSTSEQINVLDTDAVFQAGGGCGFSASGTTAFTRRALTVGAIKVHEALCPKTLKTSYLQLVMKPGSQPDTFPFAEVYTTRKASKIAKQLEVAIWQGDLSSGTANINKFDGFIKIIDAANAAVASNAKKGAGTFTSTTGAATVTGQSSTFTSQVGVGDKLYSGSVLIGTVLSIQSDTGLTLTANGAAAVTTAAYTIVPAASKSFASPVLATTGITQSNVISIINNIWLSIPSDVKGNDDVRIFAGWDVYETYIAALIALNLYAYSATNDAQKSGEFTIPGTQYVLTAVHGLDSTNRLYALRMSNMYLGSDLQHEEEKWELFWAKEADQMRFMVEWKTGVQVAFPAEIVQFTLA